MPGYTGIYRDIAGCAPRVGNDLRSLDGLLLNLFAGSQVVPASKGVAQGKLKPVARQLCPRGGEIECQRFSAPVAPDDLALGSAGLDIAEIRITPSEIERDRLAERCRDPRHQDPREIDPPGARNECRRLWKRHARVIELEAGDADAAPDERTEGTEPWQSTWTRHPAREQKKDPGYTGICRDMPGYSGI